ncbi:MAG: shikimate dehydrogenase [Clostridiales Family XIII bacterium]|jgi:shikimate dehydrogenase|nr:shikimate dehydrogenase [Clostridiales Family XIII bacterium]
MKNIVLLGMPASGKSTYGKRLARAIGFHFYDTDQEIEKAEGCSIRAIFEKKGEPVFRKMETRILTEFVQKYAKSASIVLATGGGIVENPENVKLLKQIGFTIFLDRPPKQILKNAIMGGKRPLLTDENRLMEIYGRRLPLYRKAANAVVANNKGFRKTLEDLVTLVSMRGIATDFAVIGDPIKHSISPKLHQLTFREFGKDETYSRIRVSTKRLGASLRDFRKGSLKGINVTIPHKMHIIPFLDEIRGDAIHANAVNTVVKEKNRLIGYNTDMEGLLFALKRKGFGYSGRNITLLGTGGAAAGVAHKAASEGASRLSIVGRNRESGEDLAEACRGNYVPWAEALCPESKLLSDTDVLINATPLGMQSFPEQFTDFRFMSRLPDHALACDLVYDPPQSAFLTAACARGLVILNGLPMLIYQGILADELFFDQEADRELLFNKAYAVLQNRKEDKKS